MSSPDGPVVGAHVEAPPAPRAGQQRLSARSLLTSILESRQLGAWLRRAGFEVRPVNRYHMVEGGIPEAIHTFMKLQTRPLFEVDVSVLRDQVGFAYDSLGVHPFVNVLAQYERNPSLAYGDSTLAMFYDAFRPATVRALFDIDGFSSTYLERSLRHGFQPPWFGQITCQRRGGQWQYSGPVSEEFGAAQFRKLVRLLESIQQRGYTPDKAARRTADAHIQGYVLRDGGDFRFIVTNGTHRAAVLAFLGYPHLSVTFRDHNRRVIDIRDSADWPLVRNGSLERPAAEWLFRRIFDGTDSKVTGHARDRQP